MSLPIILGLLGLLLVIVLAVGLRKRSAQTASGAQTIWMVALFIGVAAILLYFVLGPRF